MRHAFLLLIGAFVLLFVFSCGQAAERAADTLSAQNAPTMEDPTAGSASYALDNAMNEEASADSIAPTTMSSSAARATDDTNRRFIRTADLRFRVKDVVKTTYAIEDLIAGFGGHVEHTELSSRVDQRSTTPVSEDSLLETTRFTVINRATLRVPAVKLDTALKSLARFVDFLDSRTVKAEDVRLMLLSNRMTQQRIARHQQRMETAIDEQGRRLRETAGAEDRLLDRKEQADQARLSNMGLEDRIAYSTIIIDIYQRQSTRHDMLANEQSIDRYEPGFFSQLADALAFGWRMLVRIVLFMARSWSVLMIMAAVFMLLRRVFRNKPVK